jgi:hypothetical protein
MKFFAKKTKSISGLLQPLRSNLYISKHQKHISKTSTFVILILFMLYSCSEVLKIQSSNDIQLIPQKTGKWCWAATTEMCLKYLGESGIDQCDAANKVFGRNDCCSTPVPLDCINGSFPEFEKYNYSYSRTTNTALSWMEIKKQINLKKPIAFSWKYTGGGGHMMVITGYNTIDGVNYLYINDPLEVNVGSKYAISYTEFVSGPTHTHWDDFYNLTKK